MYYLDSLQVSVARFSLTLPGYSSYHSIEKACLFVNQAPHIGVVLLMIFDCHNLRSSEYRNLLCPEVDSPDQSSGQAQDLDLVNYMGLEEEAEHHHLVWSQRDSGLREDCCG